MPLSRFLKEAAFDPEAIGVIHSAFMAVCDSLQLIGGRNDTMTQIIARNVIDVARGGERDPQRIHDLVLLALKGTGQHSA